MQYKKVFGDIFPKIITWLPVLLWMGLIFQLSSGRVPSASPIFWQDFAVKKTGHFILFGVLALLIYRALRIDKVNKNNSAITAILFATLYGASDEYHQMFTQGRESRLRDVVIDGTGAMFTVLFFYYLPSKMPKKMYTFMQRFNLE